MDGPFQPAKEVALESKEVECNTQRRAIKALIEKSKKEGGKGMTVHMSICKSIQEELLTCGYKLCAFNGFRETWEPLTAPTRKAEEELRWSITWR